MRRIHTSRPLLGDEEVAAVTDVLQSGWVAQGPRVAEFERRFAERQAVGHAVATSSRTTALHLALVVAGVRPGDDVVVPSYSFVATSNAPTYVGARPVFADVDPDTGNLNAETVQAAMTPRTTAVIAVDQAGVPVDLDPIRDYCDRLAVGVIEDAASGAGSEYRGSAVGTGADVTAWSFDPRRVLTTGEGGMLTTRNAAWALRARRLREHAGSIADGGALPSGGVAGPVQYAEVGYSYRMTDLQAAVGLVQLDRMAEVVARRRRLAEVYGKAISDIEGLRAVRDPDYGRTNFQSYWVEVLEDYPVGRDGLIAALGRAGITATRAMMATHLEPLYSGHSGLVVPLPVTERLSRRTLVLPLFHQMSESEQQRVIEVLRRPERPW
ncbi:DegT/DnrJ/EryC1/StrS family aminotransferase [Nocardioides sp. YIM 152588]|uniref:DegT/DnrJ/EryC1/StrS family aminotransferase n=1 Tax=Nocardioides sp. YIM 152588 TaxID=3158259 RepID=UPI0032E5252B